MHAHGAAVTIDTAYPAEGSVRIGVRGDADAGCRRLALRVPEWVSGRAVTLLRGGEAVDAVMDDGWIVIDDALVDGAEIELRPDLDQIPALAEERNQQWARISGASFLTDAEKRALLGLPPLDGA